MTQYNDRVERQRLLIEAEDWAKGVKGLHAHSLSSMWYDNRPQDTEEGQIVTDIEYNDGVVERKLSSGETVYFGKKLTGDDLLWAYTHQG